MFKVRVLIKQMITFSFMILLVFPTLPVHAISDVITQDVSFLKTTNEGVEFLVSVPLTKLAADLITTDSGIYTKVMIPGWQSIQRAGEPEIPFLSETIGVPFGAAVEINVIPGRKRVFELHAPILPGMDREITRESQMKLDAVENFPKIINSFKNNPSIYERASSYPTVLAEIGNDAILRQQRLVSVAVYPIQYQPQQNEMVVYETLLVKVTFIGADSVDKAEHKSESDEYERLLKEDLLNYNVAQNWRWNTTASLVSSDAEFFSTLHQVATPWMPPDPGWRIRVKETGLYRISYSELESAGLDVDSLDPSTFQMFHMGEEIAIQVNLGSDTTFSFGDAIIFYGEAIESKYTWDNVYWLTYGNEIGLRVTERHVPPSTATIPSFYIAKNHMEENRLYRTLVPGGDDFERYLWDYVARENQTVKSWSHEFSLPSIYDGSGILKIMLLGYRQDDAFFPDHHASISLNGQLLEDVEWDGISWQLVDISIPAGLLNTELNTLSVTALADTGSVYDLFFIDWVELQYANTFQVENDQLAFSYDTSGDWQYRLSGFNSDQLEVFDVSDPTNIVSLDNFEIEGIEPLYSIVFEDQITVPTEYWASATTTYRSVDDIEQDIPSDLQSVVNGADYLIITHQDFANEARELQVHKNSLGLSTKLINVQDIYDEFGFGIVDVLSIQNFLKYAYYYWMEPAPTYVVLVGDGHYDPKNHLGFGRPSYIPPYLAMVDPLIGETSADNRYVAIIGEDALPDMMMGRIAVNTTDEANAFISKIITYESNPPDGDWREKTLAVADNPEVGLNFPQYLENMLSDHYPSSPYQIERVYWKQTHLVLSDARAAIQKAINEGKIIVDYVGHAYYAGWADEGLFTTSDIPALENQNKLPIILAMTCLDGYYISPYQYSSDREAMAEVITRAQGKGAIASWSPTGFGDIKGHDVLNRGFFKAVFSNGVRTIGEATQSSKLDLWSSGYNLYLLDTYLLFGDPANRIALNFTAVTDTYTVSEDELLSIPAENGVLLNDIHPQNDDLTAVLVENVSHGLLVLDADGSFVYTPDPDFYGTDSFTYKANDTVVDSNISTVEISVLPVNDPPVAINQTVSTVMNISINILLTATDDDGIDPLLTGLSSIVNSMESQSQESALTFEVLSPPIHGSLDGTAPDLVYLPDLNYFGSDSFTFIANDGEYDSNIATVTIQVFTAYSVYTPMVFR